MTRSRALVATTGSLVTLFGLLLMPAGLQAPSSQAIARPQASLPVRVVQPLSPSGQPTTQSAAPVRLELPRIGIDAAVNPVGLNSDASIQAPPSPNVTGWLAVGPAPGDPGPAVILGHLDSDRGPAVFWRLAQVRVNDAIIVARSDGSSIRFLVTRVARFSRATFPNTEVYGLTVEPELRLITCGGWFNLKARQYSDNVVVFASSTGNS